jgi:hypothetical protein
VSPLRQSGARLVGRRVVWLGFSARPKKALMLFNSYPFMFLFLPVALIGWLCWADSGTYLTVWRP